MVKKTRLKRQTFAEIVADVDAAALAPAVVAEITPGRFNGETLYDLEGHALVRSDDRPLYPVEVQTAVLAGVRLVGTHAGAEVIATYWNGWTLLLCARRLIVRHRCSARPTLWKYTP